jgi:two-component system, cell cycle sensor histidine kinase and response regulator CckA
MSPVAAPRASRSAHGATPLAFLARRGPAPRQLRLPGTPHRGGTRMFFRSRSTPRPAFPRLRQAVWLCVGLWTALVGAAVCLRLAEGRAGTEQAAVTIARANFDKDQVLRLWAAKCGGVYVPVGEYAQPSLQLEHVPDRDVTVAGGRRLTLVDPANLVGQLATEFPELYGTTGHVTSLHPRRPENAPDAWERGALARLAGGAGEVVEVSDLAGAPHLRLMRPMATRTECLKCHADQADHVGQAIGGVSVSVPLAPLQAAQRRHDAHSLWILGGLWLLGCGGILFAGRLVGQQIARRRQAAADLQRAHDLLQQEHDVYRDGPVVALQCHAEDLSVERISSNVAQVLGYEAALFAAGTVTLATVVHADDLARVAAAVHGGGQASDDVLAGRPVRLCHRNGRDVWALANFAGGERGTDGITRVRGYLIDVTGWHQAESALHESEDRLDLALQGAELGVWDWDTVTNQVVYDERFAHILGYELSELDRSLEAWSSRVHPEDYPAVVRALEAHLTGQTPIYQTEHRLRTKAGGWRWVLDTGKVIARDPAGRPLRAVGVHMDITARRNAANEREEALERFRALIDNLDSGVLVLSADRRIVQANQPFCDLLGLGNPAALTGQEARKVAGIVAGLFVSPGDFLARVEDSIKAGRLETGGELVMKDGRNIERDYVPIRVRDRLVGHLVVLRDVTRRKRLERESVRQERLAAVGQLSAGIAHDFNNILCSVMGFTELLQTTPDMPAHAQPHLDRIYRSSRRAATLVRQILDFSQRTVRNVQRVDLAECVAETVAFLQASLPEKIRIVQDTAPGLYLVDAEPAQIQQMITNLAINARDAMPGGGELRLNLRRGTADDPDAICALCDEPLAGNWLRLDVADTGTGIPAEVLPRIFEPFFTTKKVGEGTGLGLPQAAGIAAQHGGHIVARSEPGRGTSFTILMPPASTSAPAPLRERSALAHGDGRSVLLVEDEPSVREAIGAMLRHLDYRVTAAASGSEALARFGRPDATFDLVLTDVVMPDLDGEALCARLGELDPAVRIVAMSGYPLGARGDGLLERGVLAWVQKPISIDQLAAVVADALTRSAGVPAG